MIWDLNASSYAKTTKRNVQVNEEAEQDLRVKSRDIMREISTGLPS